MLSRLWSRAGKQAVSAGANACRQARGVLGGYSSAVVRPDPLIFPGLVDVKAGPLADIFARGYHIHAAGGEVPVQEQFDALIKGKEMKLLLTKIQSSDDIETHRDDIAAMAEKLRVLIDRGASTMTISADGKDVLVNQQFELLTMINSIAHHFEDGEVPRDICPVKNLVNSLRRVHRNIGLAQKRIQEFVDSGFDVNRKVIFGGYYPGTEQVIESPLLNTLIMNECDVVLLRRLIELGGARVNPDVTDGQGKTALIAAAKINNPQMVKLLLEECGDIAVDAVDSEGRTALHYACLYGNVEVAKALVAKGADLTVKDASGYAPDDLIRAKGSCVVQSLVSAGINPRRDVNAKLNAELPEVAAGVTVFAHICAERKQLQKEWPTLIRMCKPALDLGEAGLDVMM